MSLLILIFCSVASQSWSHCPSLGQASVTVSRKRCAKREKSRQLICIYTSLSLRIACPLTNQHIVDLLVHYELLHVSSESTFFMPSLLLPDPEVVSSLVSFDVLSFSPPPMLILFNEGFVPIGLFSGIVNGLLKKWEA